MSSLFKNSHELRQHLKEHPSLTPPGMSLGNLLLECGVITPSQLEKALNHQHEHPELGRLGQVLLEQGAIGAARLQSEIALHRADQEQAKHALESVIEHHPLGGLANSAIALCARLFPRLLASQAGVA